MSAIDDLTKGSDLEVGYLNRRVDDWDTRLGSLYASVENWLPAGWMVKSKPTVAMNEELMKAHNMAARQMPALELRNQSGGEASLYPKGLWIIGANGRVDLRTPSGRYVIVDLAEDFALPQWKISSVDDRSRLQPLDRQVLESVLS